jgi:predicted nuclease of predicted toxin-antitoxin system
LIIADENIDHTIIKSIREIGIEVYSIYESNRGLEDFEIIEFSKNPPRIILSEDKDFGEWVFAHNQKDISVILLRYNYSETEIIKNILKNLLIERQRELFGKFSIISVNKIRIRSL